jgi:polyphosphate kinase
MTRNLDFRVEVGCPIYDGDIKQELLDTFEISWKDNVKARVFSINQTNSYKRNGKPKIRSQFAMYDYYKNKLDTGL